MNISSPQISIINLLLYLDIFWEEKMFRKLKTLIAHDDVIKWKLFSALLALCAGNSPVTGEFPAQRPVTRSFDVFFDRLLNKRLSKQSWGW